MPNVSGITTRPEARRKEWLREYPNMRHWETVGPFATAEEAEAWEKRQHRCERHGPGDDLDYPGARWYGYRFEY